MAIHKQSLVDITIERIKNYIIENNLQSNDQFLSEKELVDRLQVSRTVIREAMKSLQSIGILKTKQGGRVYIDNASFDSIKAILKHHYDLHGAKIKELVEIRRIMELGALRLIIEKNVSVNLQHLKKINDQYYEAVRTHRDTKPFDQSFHQALIKETKNETFDNFNDVINTYFSLAKIDLMQPKEALAQSHHQHFQLIQEIADQNLPAAQQVLDAHFEPIFAFIDQMERGNKDGTD